MKRHKKILIGITLLMLVTIGITAVVMVPKAVRLSNFMEQVVIEEVNLSDIKDGTYNGNVDAGLIVVEVEVTIADHQISSIELLKHENGQGDLADGIIEKIITDQSLEVDAISGATLSSQVIKKAIETALTGRE